MSSLSQLWPEVWDSYSSRLQELGFNEELENDGVTRYTGAVEVGVPNGAGSTGVHLHNIQIDLPAAFPFKKPRIVPIDTEQPIRNQRHQAPGDAGALCLYSDSGVGWQAWTTVDELLERIRGWFRHYHLNDWGTEDQPPDLHTYFQPGSTSILVTGNDWRPPEDFSSGRFLEYRWSGRNLAYAGGPVDGAKSPTLGIAKPLDLALPGTANATTRIGCWFRLKSEPNPRAALQLMGEEIDRCTEQASGWCIHVLEALYGAKPHAPVDGVIALGYPPTGSGRREEWLFLQFSAPKGKGWRQNVHAIQLSSYEWAAAASADLMRRTAHTAHKLENKRVCIFGQGAIGSRVTMLLGESGVGNIRIVDSDRLRPANAVRHVCGIGEAGLFKSAAVMVHAAQHFPDCNIEADLETWDINELKRMISASDVVVDATAHEPFSFLLNELCVQESVPAIFAATYRRALVGRIHLVRPGIDACLACRLHYHDLDPCWVHVPPEAGSEGTFQESGCGVPTVEASAMDIDATAVQAARVAIRVIQDTVQLTNEAVVVNGVLPGFEGILSREGLHWLRWAPLRGCAVCHRTN